MGPEEPAPASRDRRPTGAAEQRDEQALLLSDIHQMAQVVEAYFEDRFGSQFKGKKRPADTRHGNSKRAKAGDGDDDDLADISHELPEEPTEAEKARHDEKLATRERYVELLYRKQRERRAAAMTVAMDRFGAYLKKTRYMAHNQASIKTKTDDQLKANRAKLLKRLK